MVFFRLILYYVQDLFLINNCEVDIEITPQTDDFMIHKDKANKNDYKFELINIKLYVKSLDLMDGLAL